MDTRVLYRRAGMIGTLIAGLLAGLIIFGGTAYAPPQGAAPVNITDQENATNSADVTADGELEVTGDVTVSGTADVNVVNTPLEVSGEVDVGNFPATQDVNVVSGSVTNQVAPVTTSRNEDFAPFDSVQNRDIAPVDASLITVAGAGDDELLIAFSSTSGVKFTIGDFDENLGPFVTIPLSQPMTIDHIFMQCNNESDDCGAIFIDIVGVQPAL
jgi:hypothetical protein